MRHVVIEIHRSELATMRREIGAWELPIVQMLHGVGNVKVLGDRDDGRNDNWPRRASEEYSRLERLYGVDKNGDGKPFVFKAYGEAPGGVMQLGSAIRRAIEVARTTPPRPLPPNDPPVDPEDVIDPDQGVDPESDVIEVPKDPPQKGKGKGKGKAKQAPPAEAPAPEAEPENTEQEDDLAS